MWGCPMRRICSWILFLSGTCGSFLLTMYTSYMIYTAVWSLVYRLRLYGLALTSHGCCWMICWMMISPTFTLLYKSCTPYVLRYRTLCAIERLIESNTGASPCLSISLSLYSGRCLFSYRSLINETYNCAVFLLPCFLWYIWIYGY